MNVPSSDLPRPSRRRGVYTAIIALLVVGTLVATAFLVAMLRDVIAVRHIPVPELPASGPITLSFTGDTTRLLPATSTIPSYLAVANAVRRSTLGFTNLEMSLPNPVGSREKPPTPNQHSRLGPDDGADIVRSLGFDWVSLANDHALDFGDLGLRSTQGALDVAGVLHAGGAADPAAGVKPAIVGRGARRAALIADTAVPAGRSAALAPLASKTEVLRRSIQGARAGAEVVVVSLHSDDDSNSQDDVTDAMRDLARAAIDAGASIVIGHGPHRVRGLEIYNGRPIFYSLGHFAYGTEGAQIERERTLDAQLGDEWWEGLLVTATYDGGELLKLEIVPLDLAGHGPAGVRGVPAQAEGERGQAILRRFSTLSAALGTAVQIDDQGLRARVPIYEKR